MLSVASYNIKGGVGKTATIVNLAYCSAYEGFRTLLWDMDPQGAASYYFRIKPKIKGGGRRLLKKKSVIEDVIKASDFEGLDILPADFSLRNLDLMLADIKNPRRKLRKILEELSDEYDMIFLDCAPSISFTSESMLFAVDAVLIPTIPTVLSLRTLDQLLAFCRDKELITTRLLPFFSMVDSRKEMHRNFLQNPPPSPEPMLQTWIPYNSQVEKMGVHRAPVADFEAHGVAAEAYQSLWEELKQRIGIS